MSNLAAFASAFVRSAGAVVALVFAAPALADEPFREPSAEMVALMDAPVLPRAFTSPDGDWLLLAQPRRWTGYDVLAENRRAAPPGAFISLQNDMITESFTLVSTADGSRWSPDGLTGDILDYPRWEPHGDRVLFLKRAEGGAELWIADPEARTVRRLTGPRVHTLLHRNADNLLNRPMSCDWLPDGARALCHLVPPNRGAPPVRDPAPHLEEVRDTTVEGRRGSETRSVPLIVSDHDAALYDHAMTSQPAFVDVETGRVTLLGEPGVYRSVAPSPDGHWFLVDRVARPYPRWNWDISFPHEVELWNARGEFVRTLATTPPSRVRAGGGVLDTYLRQGPRRFAWRPDAPAAVTYFERGPEGPDAAYTDRLMQRAAPFDAPPVELLRLTDGWLIETRWGDGLLAACEMRSDESMTWRGVLIDAAGSALGAPVELAGPPFSAEARDGVARILHDGDRIYLRGGGGLERIDLASGDRETIFETDTASYERIVDVLDAQATRLLTKAYDDLDEPANYVVVDRATGERRTLTDFDIPVPAFTQVQVRTVRYARADGLALTGTLYLPPDWSGEPGPAVVVGYPLHRIGDRPAPTEPAAPVIEPPADGPNRFANGAFFHVTTAALTSNALALEGYVVFEADMTHLGVSVEDAYDNYIDEIVADAEAAVGALVELGVADRDRIGVIGTSFGGAMVANLLARTDGLFATGVADAGPYDPLSYSAFLGFQYEPRLLWEARDTYVRNAALLHADGIDEPLLLLHGESDVKVDTDNARRLYDAIQALGGEARLVVFPNENHNLATREAALHQAWEIETWFDHYLKGVEPDEAHGAGAGGREPR